jgi:capsular exopolysaccharide synthesis family protein
MHDQMNGNTNNGSPLNGQPHGQPGVPYQVSGEARPAIRGLSPSIVFHTIKRSLWWTLPVGVLLAIAAGTTIWYTVPYRYVAKAWLRIKAERPQLAFELEESKLYTRTQIELIKSPLILREALARPDVAKLEDIQNAVSPLELMQENLKVTSVGGSELYTIGYDTKYKASSPVLVNAVLASYLEQQPQYVDKQTDDTIQLLEGEKASKADDLAQLRETLKQIISQMNHIPANLIGDPTTAVNTAEPHRPLNEINKQLGEVEYQQSNLQAELTTRQLLLTESEGDDLTEFEQIRAVEQDPEVTRMSNQRSQLMTQMDKLRERGYGKDHPRMQSMVADVERLDTLLGERRTEARAEAIRLYKANQIREHRKRVTAIETELAELKTKEGMLNEKLTEEKNELLKTGDRSLELAFTLQEVARAEDVYSRIADRIQKLQTEMGAPDRIERLRDATADTVVVSKSPIKTMTVASGGAFIIPFILALLFELRARHLSFADQVAAETQLPVLAEVSRVPTRLRTGRERKLGLRRAMYEESIDQLRISLLMSGQAQGKKVFCMSSSVSGEGKTSISSQLALSIARSENLPVLVIDADMRAPSLQTIFDCEIGPGLTEYLDGTASLDETIIKWDDYISVLPAGELNRNPNALVTYESLTALIEKIRDDYAYILIDCPPLLAATEAYVIARAVDGVLLCTMRDVSRTLQVRKAYDRLVAVGADVMGLILSGVPTYDYAYRYGGYSRYYKKYYRQEFAENTKPASTP